MCADCLIGKSQQRPHWRHGSNKGATAFLQRLHLDCTARHPTKLFGTASPSGMRHMLSPSGMRHMLVIVDDWSGYKWTYFVKSVTDRTEVFKRFLRVQCRQMTHHPVRCVRTDGGPDFATAFSGLLAHAGIIHEQTPADSSETNGVAESTIKVIIERARTMLAWSDLPNTFWSEAAQHATHLLNITPTSHGRNGDMSPYRLRTGHEHDLSSLVPFGCLALVHVKPIDRGGKMNTAATTGVFLGHGEPSAGGLQGYRIYKPSTNRVVIRHDVSFNPSVPALGHIYARAATSVVTQFLGRHVRRRLNLKTRNGIVHSTFKTPRGTDTWTLHYPEDDLWETVTLQQLLECLRPHNHRLPHDLRRRALTRPPGHSADITTPHQPAQSHADTARPGMERTMLKHLPSILLDLELAHPPAHHWTKNGHSHATSTVTALLSHLGLFGRCDSTH